jgi:DNA-binding CsgD family transcriptional regulator
VADFDALLTMLDPEAVLRVDETAALFPASIQEAHGAAREMRGATRLPEEPSAEEAPAGQRWRSWTALCAASWRRSASPCSCSALRSRTGRSSRSRRSLTRCGCASPRSRYSSTRNVAAIAKTPSLKCFEAIRQHERVRTKYTRHLMWRFTAVRFPSPREREVLRLIARGLSNREIAAALVVEESTIRTHIKRILLKLELRDRAQVAIFACETGLSRAGATTTRALAVVRTHRLAGTSTPPARPPSGRCESPFVRRLQRPSALSHAGERWCLNADPS